MKKLGPTSWECVDSKLAWSRLVGRMMMTKMMTMMMIKMVTMMTKMTKMMTMMMMAEMMIFVRLSQKIVFLSARDLCGSKPLLIYLSRFSIMIVIVNLVALLVILVDFFYWFAVLVDLFVVFC